MSYKAENEDFPVMVHQICAYACNSRCIHCPFTETHSDAQKRYKSINSLFVTPEIFRKTADETGRHSAILRLTGGGETLLCPRILELVEYATEKNCKVGIITNGSLLTPSTSMRLVDAGVDNIEISVDAGDRETYSKIRVGLDWNKLLSNVNSLVEYRNKVNAGTKVYVSIINQKCISPKLQKAVSFWNKRVDQVMVRKYMTFGILNDNESGDRVPFQDMNAPCPWIFKRVSVDTNGDFLVCGHEQIKRHMNLGNIMDTTIKAVWKGGMRKLQEDMIADVSRIPLCKNCDDRRFKSWEYDYLKILEKAGAKNNKS